MLWDTPLPAAYVTTCSLKQEWKGGLPHAFFEMRISKSELTDMTTLIITDFATDNDEQDELTDLWDQQVDSLKRTMGIN